MALMTTSDKPKKDQKSAAPLDYEIPSWSRWTRRFIIVLIIIGGVYALTFLGSVIHLILTSLILVFLFFAPARAITRRFRMPYPLSVFVIYCIFGMVLIVGIFSFIPTVLTWAVDFTNSAIYVYSEVQDDLEDYTYDDGILEVFNIQVDFNFVLEPVRKIMLGQDIISDDTDAVPKNIIRAEEIDLQAILNQTLNVVGTLTSAVTNVANILLQLLAVGLLSFLMLLEIPNFYHSFYTSVPTPYRREYGLLSLRVLKVWNSFFKGEATIAIIIGVLTWGQLELMGVPGASIIGIFTGTISLIPTLGGLIALIPLTIVPLLQGSTVMTDAHPLVLVLSVVLINLTMQQLIWNLLAPKIIGDAVSVPLSFIIVGLFVGASVGGFLGAFLVSPILGTIKVILIYIFHKLADEDPFPNQADPRLGERGIFEHEIQATS